MVPGAAGWITWIVWRHVQWFLRWRAVPGMCPPLGGRSVWFCIAVFLCLVDGGVFKIVLLLLSRCVLAGLVCLGELCRAETTAGVVGGALYTRVRGGVSWVPLKLGSDHSVISNLSICTL